MSITYQTTLSPNVPIESLSQDFAYNVGNQLTSVTVVYQGVTYVQTFTYTGQNLTNVSNWVAQ